MNVPLVHCRAAGVELLLPTNGLRLLSSASDLARNGEAFRWNGEEFPAVRLREKLGSAPRETGDEAVALFTIEGEPFAVVADELVGLVPGEALSTWTVPRGWLLRKGAFPYHQFVARGELLAAEVSLLPLLLPAYGERSDERTRFEGLPVGEGTFVVGRIGDQRIALELGEVVEVVSELAYVPFPGLPRLVAGLAVHRKAPVPVLSLEPGQETGAFAILRCRDTSFALALRTAERVRAFSAAAPSAPGPPGPPAGALEAGAPAASQDPVLLRADSLWRLV